MQGDVNGRIHIPTPKDGPRPALWERTAQFTTPCAARARGDGAKGPRAAASGPVRAAFPAACREARADADGARWFQTFPPYGRYPVGGTVPGAREGAEFVLDAASARAVMDAFARDAARPGWPGVLVDREHFSADPDKPSDALAWARGIRQAPDGSIWTRWDFTPAGARLWEDRVLVSRSPYFLNDVSADGLEYRPARLVSIGMTNTPHFESLSTLAAARAADANTETQGEIQMQKILEALWLAEGATEEDALAAIQGLKDRASAAEAQAIEAGKKRDEAVAECRETKAEAFVQANAGKIADAAAAKAAYVKDPALAEALVAACRAAPARPSQQLLRPAPAARPPAAGGVMERLAACRSAEERCAFAQAHAKEIAAANRQ